MKFIVCCLLSFLFIAHTNAQDSLKMKRIDSIARMIDTADYKMVYDSIRQDQPEAGIKMVTYLTSITDGWHLKKFINNVKGATIKNGLAEEFNTYNIFYFNMQKLIKVEEIAIMKDKKLRVDWYYENDAPLSFNYKSEKSADRALLLLNLGRQISEQYEKLK